ncbi:MAG: alpha/beta hydrolase [Burkholderiaceae bacterium]|nr:alpha/beta hydrolase [Burkholderiaceae bacterium]
MSHQPKLHHVGANGLTLACFEWRAPLRGAAPTIWMVHATGFHGRVWDQVIRYLPGQHVIAVDQRGHGRSGGTGFDSWADFGRDQAALAAAMDLQGAVGVGHSMGAHALVQAAAYAPGRFRQLVLIDPVIRSPAEYHQPQPPPGTLHPSAQRKNRFVSAQEMFERFADRPPYSVFDTQALQDYCQHGLKPAADGQGFELACAPGFEGRVYPTALANAGIYASIRALQIPVLVVRARPQDPSIKPWDALGTPTYAQLAQEFRFGRDLRLLDKTHMLPMEDPALVARLIGDAMAAAGA